MDFSSADERPRLASVEAMAVQTAPGQCHVDPDFRSVDKREQHSEAESSAYVDSSRTENQEFLRQWKTSSIELKTYGASHWARHISISRRRICAFLSEILLLFALQITPAETFVTPAATHAPKSYIPSYKSQVSNEYNTFCRVQPTSKPIGAFGVNREVQCWLLPRISSASGSSTRLYEQTAVTETAEESATADSGPNGVIPEDGEIIKANGATTIGIDVPRPTANGGFTHTSASRAKIAAANKGKVPWNKGKQRSPEVRARIAAGVRAKNRERFLKKLADMGLTEEEYEAQQKEKRRKKDAEKRKRLTENGGRKLSEETKQKISKSLKERHANGTIKKQPVDPSKIRRGFTHSEETRRKISETLKKKWADDTGYRNTMTEKSSNTNPSTRQRISEAMKKKWQDPEFRESQVKSIQGRAKPPKESYGQSYREKISQAMKQKWQDEEYRSKALKAIRDRASKQREMRPKLEKRPRIKKPRKPKEKKAKGAVIRLLQPTVGGEAIKTKVSKKRRKRRAVKGSTTTALKSAATVTKGTAKAVVPLKIAKKKAAKKSKRKKEPDGSVNRLREERRDLFDLLYGDSAAPVDDDDDDDDFADVSDQNDSNKGGYGFADENLDDFDPYGLDDY